MPLPYRIVPVGGLCNRLRVILSWKRKADSEGRMLHVYWPITVHCNGSFSKHFKPIENVRIFEWEPSPDQAIDYNGFDACGPYDTHALQLQPQLQERVEALKRQLGVYDAVHIRRTDLTPVAVRDGNFTDDSVFYNFISASRHPVYLASDNKGTQLSCKGQFGQKIHFMYEIPASRVNVFRQTPLEYAIMDIYMCAGARSFLGTVGSSFSDFIKVMRQ